MPKFVDHDQRRREIVDAFLKIVSRSGHEAATSRAVAREVGISDGVLWHYFINFDAVVQGAAEEIGTRTLDRIARSTDGLRGLARLDALMQDVLPMTESAREEAVVVVGFWGRLAHRSGLSSSTRLAHRWTPQLNEAVREAIFDGELRSDTPIETLVTLLQSVTYGQQVSQVVNPMTDVADHSIVLRACIDPWRTVG